MQAFFVSEILAWPYFLSLQVWPRLLLENYVVPIAKLLYGNALKAKGVRVAICIGCNVVRVAICNGC